MKRVAWNMEQNMKKILAIDWGEKRIGLALSEDGHFAFPFKVIENTNPSFDPPLRKGRTIEELENILAERKIEKIILGWPIGLSGNETDKTKEVEKFYQELLKLGIPIEKIDERYSTKMVPNEGRGVDMKDAVSAQILLQEYLDMGR